MKSIYIIFGIWVIVLAIVVFALEKPTNGVLGGISSNTCTASTTAWSVGPQESKTVLPARSNRLSFSLSVIAANTTGTYRLDSTAATALNGHPISASSTVHFTETYPYRGVVTAASVASTTMLVTECLY